MSPFETTSPDEPGEEERPIYEDVSATVPLKSGAAVEMLAYRLVSGQVKLTQDVPEGTNVASGERIVKYFRSDDAIIRIDPDGKIHKLDLVELKNGRVVMEQRIGYAIGGKAEMGKPLIATVGINNGKPIGGQLIANVWGDQTLTKGPLTEVLVRTSRPVPVENSFPTTDTPIKIGTPQEFIGK